MSIRLAIRFDMRAPDLGAPVARAVSARWSCASDADSAGFDTVYLAEHHGADDGYCALAVGVSRRDRPVAPPGCGLHLRP